MAKVGRPYSTADLFRERLALSPDFVARIRATGLSPEAVERIKAMRPPPEMLERLKLPGAPEMAQWLERNLRQPDEGTQAAPEPPAAEKGPRPTDVSPVTARIPTKQWWNWACAEYPKQPGENNTQWADRLHGEMKKAPVTVLWAEATCRRRLYDKISDPAAPFTDPAGPFIPDGQK
jgi:hypothetical protein